MNILTRTLLLISLLTLFAISVNASGEMIGNGVPAPYFYTVMDNNQSISNPYNGSTTTLLNGLGVYICGSDNDAIFSGNCSAYHDLNGVGLFEFSPSESDFGTMAFWTKTHNIENYSGGGGPYWFSMDNPGDLRTSFYTQGNITRMILGNNKNSVYGSSPQVFLNAQGEGKWVHICMTWSIGSQKLFVNGSLFATDSESHDTDTPVDWVIGTDDQGRDNPVLGQMDEVAWWGYMFTDEQCTGLYKNYSGSGDFVAPTITYINCTSCNNNATLNGSDTTPSFNVSLSEAGFCAITSNCTGGTGANTFDDMNSSTTTCGETDALQTTRTCTLASAHQLDNPHNLRSACDMFISCEDVAGNNLATDWNGRLYLDSGYWNFDASTIEYSATVVSQNATAPTVTVTANCPASNVINCTDLYSWTHIQ